MRAVVAGWHCGSLTGAFNHSEKNGAVMNTQEKDVATLIELLKMAAERSPHFANDHISQRDLLREDCSLLEMWPEACRRTGTGKREFPRDVLTLWKKRLGRPN
jgi:hypothetical protein